MLLSLRPTWLFTVDFLEKKCPTIEMQVFGSYQETQIEFNPQHSGYAKEGWIRILLM